MDKVVLAYSGGLDTSVAIKWLKEQYGLDVVAVTIDVGEGKDYEFARQKALKIGAVGAHVVDARKEFVEEYLWPALKANALYENTYPLATALARPLIAKILVDIAEKEGAVAIAHGCTGKGNDQVRFDVSIHALNPDLRIIAPQREKPMPREEAIEYAKANGIPVPVGKKNPFSVDQNLWGRSCECGVLEDPWNEPPEEAYEWTKAVSDTPDTPEYIEITFAEGVPVKLNGQAMDGVTLIETLHELAGKHGIGRIDQLENRLVGIKSREIYEAPAAQVLIAAHRELETFTNPRDSIHFKQIMDQKYGELVYDGLYFSPLMKALQAFNDEVQKTVNGTIRMKLFKGTATVVGRKSEQALYQEKLATYTNEDEFNHQAAVGFIELWGLPVKVYNQVNKK